MSVALAIFGVGAVLGVGYLATRADTPPSTASSGSTATPGGPPNFPYSEAERSSTASRLGVANTMTPAARAAWDQLAGAILAPLRARFGPLRITSGYRSLPLTAAMRSEASRTGAPMPASPSQHEKGEAADTLPVSPSYTAADVAEYLFASGLPVDQVLLYEDTNHIHVSYVQGKPPRRDFRFQPKVGRTVSLTPQIIAAWRKARA